MRQADGTSTSSWGPKLEELTRAIDTSAAEREEIRRKLQSIVDAQQEERAQSKDEAKALDDIRTLLRGMVRE